MILVELFFVLNLVCYAMLCYASTKFRNIQYLEIPSCILQIKYILFGNLIYSKHIHVKHATLFLKFFLNYSKIQRI